MRIRLIKTKYLVKKIFVFDMGSTKICFHVLDLCSIFNSRAINNTINNGRKKKCTPLNPFLKYSFHGFTPA
jgi:hypothetical protein